MMSNAIPAPDDLRRHHANANRSYAAKICNTHRHGRPARRVDGIVATFAKIFHSVSVSRGTAIHPRRMRSRKQSCKDQACGVFTLVRAMLGLTFAILSAKDG